MESKLSHIDESGNAHMVDVGGKSDTERVAIAKGEVLMKAETLELIQKSKLEKGDIFTTAKIAGVMAAKQTASLIPLCHVVQLTHIDVILKAVSELPGISIQAIVSSTGKTGVEMEALTAVSIAALTVYDMAKAVEKTMRIQNIRLVEKHGGRSGDIKNE